MPRQRTAADAFPARNKALLLPSTLIVSIWLSEISDSGVQILEQTGMPMN
jgi:hypothetical protein